MPAAGEEQHEWLGRRREQRTPHRGRRMLLELVRTDLREAPRGLLGVEAGLGRDAERARHLVGGARVGTIDPGSVIDASDAALRDGVPVRLVEHELAEVPEPVRARRPGRMVVVEVEQRALAVADLEEAHHLARVAGLLAPPAPGPGPRPRRARPRRCLEVGGRAGLRERQVGGVAKRVDVRRDRPTSSVCGRSAASPGAGREAGVDEDLGALVRRHQDQQVVGQLLALEAARPPCAPGRWTRR